MVSVVSASPVVSVVSAVSEVPVVSAGSVESVVPVVSVGSEVPEVPVVSAVSLVPVVSVGSEVPVLSEVSLIITSPVTGSTTGSPVSGSTHIGLLSASKSGTNTEKSIGVSSVVAETLCSQSYNSCDVTNPSPSASISLNVPPIHVSSTPYTEASQASRSIGSSSYIE